MSESTHPTLPIDPHHVARQFARRGDLAEAAFLYDEIGARMLERLAYIRLAPAALLDAGCGTGTARAGLAERFADAAYVGLDLCAPLLAIARERHGASPGGAARLNQWIARLRGKERAGATAPQFLEGDLAASGLAPGSVDMVWSNLALHWHPAPHDVLAEWWRVLRPDGLAMFSCLGPGTLRELRDAVADAGLRTATLPFVDMHDFGDLLVESGFADPVMDQETLTLTYTSGDKLLADVRALGGNPTRGRHPGLAGRGFRRRLVEALDARRAADGLIHLSIEVAYGHAWRAAARRTASGETQISISAIGRGSRP
ncbi:methyltransferase domain-containing protein [Verticiella sediminum]|uniref:Malonyl-[acyl-carrier protein] O-methyltransferase n=1 Tax=Verticiella sediminum TaxID=1247510 RepID=A0A556A861_9BURK|nr:methyltransferase domain-containing protein [Verticiella sediminum]TSH89084.1 methyltransferase domain-containing protein [Verticiella sediminum]